MKTLLLTLFLITLSCSAYSQAIVTPVLISATDSTRAITLNAEALTPEPFSLQSPFSSTPDRRTRIMLFALNLPESKTSLKAYAEAGDHTLYPLTIEYLGNVGELPGLKSVTVRINDLLPMSGDMLVYVTSSGVPSNSVRIGFGAIGGGLADNPLSTFTPYTQSFGNVTGSIIYDGNSLMVGIGGSMSFPGRVMALIGPGYRWENVAVSGQRTFDMIARAPVQVDAKFDPQITNVVVAWELTNELGWGASADYVFANYETYCRDRKAHGFKVIILTCLPRTGPGDGAALEARRLAVNERIRAEYANFADGLIDVAAIPEISTVESTKDRKLYVDGVHLTDRGYSLVANLAVPEIRRVLSH